MMDADIQTLYEYNRWANARVVKAVSRLSVEQFTRDLGSSFPSIRDTLVHILFAEWLWLERWKGTSPTVMFDPAEFPSVDVVKEKWREVESDCISFVRGLTAARLDTVVRYTNMDDETLEFRLGDMMKHVVNHSSYHRGQIVTMLRQLGAEPSATDLLEFLHEKRYG